MVEQKLSNVVPVNTRGGKYSVVIGEGLDFGELALGVKEPCQVVIVSDDKVFPLYGDTVMKSLAKNGYRVGAYIVNNGEKAKSIEVVTRLLRFLVDQGMTRNGILVALGGGVVGDIAGFASAVYQRGIDFIQLPTTILAAVDSSVGGKTGVDLPEAKNVVGAFHHPLGVFCDTGTFATLPKAVYADGMAEVVKHGMIADRDMFMNLGELAIAEICRRNVEIKAGIVEKDEFDTGIRHLLNFGHTVGHAVEALSKYAIPHGSAVAIGMTVITRAAEKAGLTKSACLGELTRTLEHLGLPTSCEYSANDIAKVAMHDKKRSGDTITLVIPKEIGCAELHKLPVAQLEDFIGKGLGA
ncbi:MAG: 3-dehydroquinate synthase [Treponema sp.]|nr:3-dehydroquinate synthase [Treponema sp.]